MISVRESEKKPEIRTGRVKCLSPGGFHHMAYVEWGDPSNSRVLVCVHGLTRCARDFDFLARALQNDFRVVCPDVVGRGQSDWLQNKSLYGIPQYCADMMVLLARLNVAEIVWLGTSMGGLIGMALAAGANSPIRRLVLNDVGPVVSAVSMKRIGDYLGRPISFESIEQAEAALRVIAAPFGLLSDAQWRHLTTHSCRTNAEGKLVFAYDPGIADPFRTLVAASEGRDMDLWPMFDAIRCPTLVMRGAESDLLTRETVQAMAQRGPRARWIEFPGIGHAPALMTSDQQTPVRDFLLST